MKKITVVSGKGGVGKTSFTAALTYELHARGRNLLAIDTDVDAPNLALVLKGNLKEKIPIVTSKIPEINPELCDSCNLCVKYCKSKALINGENGDTPILRSYLCEGCGLCKYVCPTHAIKLVEHKNGFIAVYDTIYGFKLVSGQIYIGGSASGKIVKETKERGYEFANFDTEYIIIDGPPGSSCPAISAISDVDYVVFITEPTPTALHDLKRIIQVNKSFKIPAGAIINKADIHEPTLKQLEEYLSSEGIQVLGKVPYDDRIPESIVKGEPFNKDRENSLAKIIKFITDDIENILSGSD